MARPRRRLATVAVLDDENVRMEADHALMRLAFAPGAVQFDRSGVLREFDGRPGADLKARVVEMYEDSGLGYPHGFGPGIEN